MAIRCNNCGAMLPYTVNFCTECGTKLDKVEEMKSTCSNCGAELREGANFCVECGTPIERSVQFEESETNDFLFEMESKESELEAHKQKLKLIWFLIM